ncbi:hypothetical protein D3C87_1543730 [compost metagenome]
MLGQVPGETDQLPRQAQHPSQYRALGVETALEQAFHRWGFVAPVTAAIGQGVDLVRRQTQRLGHVAHRARRVVGADHRRQRSAGTAITLEHVLQDFLTPLVLEIDVDVRRFVALPGKKTLKQQRAAIRIDFGDAQGKTHRRVSGGTASLTENLLVTGETHDVVDRQEIAFVIQFGNQLQFLVDLLQHLDLRAFWPTPGNALFCQIAQPR